jgi:hypothetical protein
MCFKSNNGLPLSFFTSGSLLALVQAGYFCADWRWSNHPNADNAREAENNRDNK